MTSPEVFDLHAHAVLTAPLGTAGAYGPELTDDDPPTFRVGDYIMRPAPYRDTVFTDLRRRLDAMARIGITTQMVSPNPLTFFGSIEPEPAVRYATATNVAMAELVASDPDHLVGSAQVPLQSPVDACREAEHGASLGLRGVYIGTNYPIALDDPALDQFYETMVDLDMALFIHAATNTGIGPAPDARLHRYGLDLVAGYTNEETIAVATLILGGVLDRHPDLDICVSHGGGAAAFLVERFNSMAKFRRQPADFADHLRRLWFDAHMEPGPARDLLIELVGTDHLVYGTNMGGWDTPETADAFDASLTPNARRLLRLPRSTEVAG